MVIGMVYNLVYSEMASSIINFGSCVYVCLTALVMATQKPVFNNSVKNSACMCVCLGVFAHVLHDLSTSKCDIIRAVTSTRRLLW